LAAVFGGGLLLAGGCSGTPSKVNIELRKKNQDLSSQIDELQMRHSADEATIRGLQSHATTVPILPEDELDQLFTTAGLRFDRLTGGYHPDPNQPGDTMLKIYVVPIDASGDDIKAAGTFHVELFDPALGATNRIGQWDFDLQAAKANWYGKALLYEYVLSCPWQIVPTHGKLLVRVTFTDALTHRVFTVDREVLVQVPAQ
jgi:outer membrane murein-binding lipoprotein Lpp